MLIEGSWVGVVGLVCLWGQFLEYLYVLTRESISNRVMYAGYMFS